MKKLLSILTSISVASVAATSVVACSVPSTHVDVNFNAGNDGKLQSNADGSEYTWKKGTKYSKSDLDTALNGNAAILNSYFPAAMSFDELNSQLLSLVSFNQSLTVKTQKDQKQLRDFRNTYLGRDSNEVTKDNYKDMATVDGIKYKKIDSDKYYDSFKNTNINSLVGLQDLYKASQSGTTIPDSLKDSLTQAKNLFGNNLKDVNDLMDNFANSKKNPAFTNITYNTDLQEYNSYSQILPAFDKNNGNGADGSTISLGGLNSYVDNNNGIKDDDKKDLDKKTISDKATADPYGALILPTTDDLSQGIKTSTLENIENDDSSKNQTLKELFTNKEDNVYYSQSKTKDQDKDVYSFNQNFGQYLIKKANPLNVTYHFETDMEHNAKNWTEKKKDSKGFNISFTLDNLVEVFSPYITGVDGTTISSVEHQSDDIVKIFFNKTDVKDDFVKNISGISNPSEVKHDKDNKGNATNSWITAKLSGDEISYADGKAKLSYKVNEKSDSTFETSQLSWVFRGYKFISQDAMDNKTGSFGWDDSVTSEKLVDEDKDTKAPKRDGNLLAEITHHLRDVKTSDWNIEGSSEPKGPHYTSNN